MDATHVAGESNDQSIFVELQANDNSLDELAQKIALQGTINLTHVDINNIKLDDLDTKDLFAITRETQKIENEDQLLPTPKNKQNEVVRGAVENMKRQ
jgi:hypothetical protein